MIAAPRRRRLRFLPRLSVRNGALAVLVLVVLGCGWLWFRSSSLVAIKVGEVHRVVCASPAYCARRGQPYDPRELADHAREVGVEVSFELYEGTYLGTADSALRFLADIDRDNVGLNPDLGNLIRMQQPIEPWESMAVKTLPFANYWHVKNYARAENPNAGIYLTSPTSLAAGLIDYRRAIAFGDGVRDRRQIGDDRADRQPCAPFIIEGGNHAVILQLELLIERKAHQRALLHHRKCS